jgi:hypothetical protein
MQGNDLDTYIATFDHLRDTAGWEIDSQGTILLFRRGLHPALAQAVINRTIPRPVTFEDWANAARTQHAIWVESRAVMGTQGTQRNDGFSSPRWRQALGGRRQRDPNAMDVDLAEIGRMSDDERKKLRTEGRCFFCKAQGHMSRQCPKKTQTRTSNSSNFVRPRTINARAADTESEADTCVNTVTSTSDRKAVLRGIQGMSLEERTQLLDDLILEDRPSSGF